MFTKETKRLIGKFTAIFFGFYAAITLLPACVYAFTTKDEPNETKVSVENFLDGRKIADLGQNDVKPEHFTLYDKAEDTTLTLTADELLPAAISCEMDLSAPREALKAQAIATYTLFCHRRDSGETIVCDSENWEIYTTENQMRTRWGDEYNANIALLRNIVEEISNKVITYQDKPILAAYCAISDGITETAGNAWQSDTPYLQAVASAGDAFSDGYMSTVHMTADEFKAAANKLDGTLKFSDKPETWLTDIELTPSGYVKTAVLCGKITGGQELRTAFSLRSQCFNVEYTDNEFVFTVRGWGHGVGMSQAGAIFMAKSGASCEEILSHYYPNTVISDSSHDK